MFLTDSDIQLIKSYFQTISYLPVYLISPAWHIVFGNEEQKLDYVQHIISQHSSESDIEKLCSLHEITMEPFYMEDILVCYCLVLKKNASLVVQYMKGILRILLSSQNTGSQDLSDYNRNMLINQLVAFEYRYHDIDPFIKEFKYSTHCPRCAIIFKPEFSENIKHSDDYSRLDQYFKSAVCSSPDFSNNDIFGNINTETLIIFKDVSKLSSDENHSNYIKDYIEAIIKGLQSQSSLIFYATCGSIYYSLENIKHSYKEAMFLLNNYSSLSSCDSCFLDINEYLFEYFVSLLPDTCWKNYLDEIFEDVKKNPSLLKVLKELCRNNFVLTNTASALNIHRNSVMNRCNTIKNLTGLNPFSNNYDQILTRAFTVFQNQNLILNAAITMQPNSPIHHGMEKMAELLRLKSNDTIRLNIYTLSLSNNNSNLFEMVRTGALDFASILTNILNQFTDNRSKLMELPFLFDSYEEANEILNTYILSDLENIFEAAGVKVLNIWTMGWRYLTSKMPVRVPKDMSKKKIRIMYSHSLEDFYSAMGATIIRTGYDDLKSALESDIIDCQENPYSNILGMKLYEEQHYITHLKYLLSTEGLFISLSTWNRLTSLQKMWITEAARETTDWIFNMQNKTINDHCKNILLNEKGMQLIELNDNEIQEWRSCASEMYRTFPHQAVLNKVQHLKELYHAKQKNTKNDQ